MARHLEANAGADSGVHPTNPSTRFRSTSMSVAPSIRSDRSSWRWRRPHRRACSCATSATRSCRRCYCDRTICSEHWYRSRRPEVLSLAHEKLVSCRPDHGEAGSAHRSSPCVRRKSGGLPAHRRGANKSLRPEPATSIDAAPDTTPEDHDMPDAADTPEADALLDAAEEESGPSYGRRPPGRPDGDAGASDAGT